MSDELRNLAAQLRDEAEKRAALKSEKCAQIIVAAKGLALLQRKLGGTNA